jgi:prepilin-type N-terminal cleavage/methylation domain-containing protein
MSRRRGVTILELLIALSISALLLLATAVAVDASVRAYKNNQEQSSLIQRSRIAIDRLTTVIRTTKDHQPYSATAASGFKNGQVVSDIGVDLFDVNGLAADPRSRRREDLRPGQRRHRLLHQARADAQPRIRSHRRRLGPAPAGNNLPHCEDHR